MKKMIIFCFFCFVSILSFSQITNIKTGDSSVVVKKVYAGLLGTTIFPLDNPIGVTHGIDLRVGAEATYKMNNYFSVSGFSALGLSDLSLNQIHSLKVSFRASDKFKISVGKIPTPSAIYHRPSPISGGGHFEPWVLAQIPGCQTGTTLELGDSTSVKMGVFTDHSGKPMYQIGFSLRQIITFSAWLENNHYGKVFTVKNKKGSFSTTFVVTDEIMANLLLFPVFRLNFYSDLGFSIIDKKLIRGEWGILKIFPGELLSGIIGFGYSQEIRGVKGYLFIHL